MLSALFITAGAGADEGTAAPPVAAAPAPQPRKIEASLSREEIGGVVRASYADIKACYERSSAMEEERSGSVQLAFTIGGDGRVHRVEVDRDTLGDATVTTCVVDIAAGWRFPLPRGGGKVLVTYPFIFSPDDKPKPSFFVWVSRLLCR